MKESILFIYFEVLIFNFNKVFLIINLIFYYCK